MPKKNKYRNMWQINNGTYFKNSLLIYHKDQIEFAKHLFTQDLLYNTQPSFIKQCNTYYDEYIKKKMSEYIFILNQCDLVYDITKYISIILYCVLR